MDTQKEKLLQGTYEKFMAVCTSESGSLDVLDNLTINNILGFGTAEDERIFSTDELKKMIKNQREQGVGMKIKWDFQPLFRRVSKDENNALFIDDLFVNIKLNDEWIRMPLRFSTLLEHLDGQWKVVHFHGSKPDEAESEKDTYGIDEWKRKNEELERLVAEKTADLVLKNKELEIETSLEKVRAIAMGMKASNDMLEVCKTISLQLQSLGVEEIRNVQTAIFYPTKGSYMNYEYYSKHKKSFITDTIYTNHKIAKVFAKKMLQGKGEIFITHIKGKKVKDWIAYQETTNVFIDIYLNKATSLNYYWHSLGPVALGISTYTPLSKNDLKLFNRFLNVFELAYTRYLDIEKALAQTRESQIELALERVRARTMAMQNSNELPETSLLLFQQFKELGEIAEQISIGIIDEEEGIVEISATLHGSQLQQTYELKTDEPFVLKKAVKAWKARKKSLIIELAGKELTEYNTWRNTLGGVDFKKYKKNEERWIINLAFFSKGMLSFSMNTPCPAETVYLLERFAQVFDQTYSRFLDLKKAEAQAREAKIEAALERVRARTMAMHKSDELKEVIQVVYDQFVHLNIHIEHTGFILDYKERDDMHIWLADQNAVFSEIILPYFDCAHWNSFIDAKKKGKNFFANQLPFKEKNKFYKDLFKQILDIPKEAKDHYLTCPALAISTVLLDNVGLYIENFEGIPYTDEENEVLMRFGKVFQQTYTRFLDLQKAEAQAREARIELALERLRARTMAMQHSDELREAVLVIYQQLLHLDFASDACNIIIIDKESMDMQFWVSGFSQEIYPESYHVPRLHHPCHEEQLTAWQQGLKYVVFEYSGNEKKSFDKIFFTKTDFKNVPEDAKKVMIGLKLLKLSTAFFNYGALQVLGAEVLSDDKAKILQRFAKVFEQTYTRFLDLQKAEAQAKEAQIEASLERVRSKTMAMHNSQDVGESVATLFDELVKLGVKTNRCGILIHNDEQFAEVWTAKSNPNEKATLIIGKLEIAMHPMLIGARTSWANKEPFFSYELTGQDMINYYQSINNSKYYLTQFVLEELPPKEIHSDFYFSDGSLFAFTNEAIPAESAGIFKRFTSVFGQTYRRYLDLQKAEAQAREARIELSIERIRAGAMAMRHSKELNALIVDLYQELTKLDAQLDRAFIMIVNPENEDITWWLAGKEGLLAENGFLIRNNQYPTHLMYLDFWHQRQKKWQYLFEGQEKTDWDRYGFQKTSLARLPEIVKRDMANVKKIYLSGSSEAFGNLVTGSLEPLSEEHHDIISRFTVVFNQSYTRFLDLQKAEAQAREAIKQSSLDRVRGEIASMRSTEDLKRITPLIWRELTNLGVPFFRCGVFIIDEIKAQVNVYLSAPDGHSLGVMHLDFSANELTTHTVASWRKKEIFQTHWDKTDFLGWMEALRELGHISDLELYQGSELPPESLDLHFIPFKQGMLYIGNNTPLQKEK
ncbi:MAG: nuclear transport factor 2 family protein [Saprospiraceae bacterium]|nr:nuclear transport factor 2 family protein [Saprospiraceae bacterium]